MRRLFGLKKRCTWKLVLVSHHNHLVMGAHRYNQQNRQVIGVRVVRVKLLLMLFNTGSE